MGLTGLVFKTQKVIHESDVRKQKLFMPSLDNTCRDVKDVNSIMIAPIFGHNNLDGSPNLVAIMQMVNKIDGIITDHDVVSTKRMCFLYFVYVVGQDTNDVKIDWVVDLERF